MNDIRAKVAYLQGLAEGLDLDTGSAEGRVLSSMLDVLVDIADEMQNVVEAQEELAEYVEDVDYDLGALEETIYELDEEDNGETQFIRFVPEHQMMMNDDGISLTMCPECGETLAASVGDMDDDLDVICPGCGCMVESDYDSEETHA